jgi:sialic acid synthase SpsE
MQVGAKLTIQNLRSVRPGYGMPPKHLNLLLGKSVNCELKAGMPMLATYLDFTS